MSLYFFVLYFVFFVNKLEIYMSNYTAQVEFSPIFYFISSYQPILLKLDAYLVTYNPNKVRTNTYCFQKLVVSQCSWHLMLFVFAVKMLTQNKNRNKAKTRIRLCFTSPSMRLVNPKYFYRQSVTNLVSTCNNTNSLKNYRNNIMNHCDT